MQPDIYNSPTDLGSETVTLNQHLLNKHWPLRDQTGIYCRADCKVFVVWQSPSELAFATHILSKQIRLFFQRLTRESVSTTSFSSGTFLGVYSSLELMIFTSSLMSIKLSEETSAAAAAAAAAVLVRTTTGLKWSGEGVNKSPFLSHVRM